MAHNDAKTRILIFIGSLRSGGKERRLIELLNFLKGKDNLEFLIVLTLDEIHYPAFYDLGIPYRVIDKKWSKNDPTVFYQFYKICREFKPHLIHTWGRIQSFYALPAVIGQKVPLINSQITAAPPKSNKWSIPGLIDKINFRFSRFVLSNSEAGIKSFNPPSEKGKVIYNGINMNRFINLPSVELVKSKYGITTPYTVVMSASFSSNKDYDLFYKVAEQVTQVRDDVTFIGVGMCHDQAKFRRLLEMAESNPRILFPGRIDDVEALVNASNLGVLFSNKSVHGEGISNSIMEYMALSKPVIANDAGGTKEILHHNENGYLIVDQNAEEIVSLIINLIGDESKCKSFGEASRRIIEESFSIEKMGKAFEQIYEAALMYRSSPLG